MPTPHYNVALADLLASRIQAESKAELASAIATALTDVLTDPNTCNLHLVLDVLADYEMLLHNRRIDATGRHPASEVTKARIALSALLEPGTSS
ncbi:hypothetical protein [Marinobacter sp. MBR-105]|jgi:phenylpyruvate tautomerase PptA (4-oxalocrotonate tautomerase family)